jgi:hypothetical protein
LPRKRKKTLDLWPRVASLFVVTHQGPAQGGKAGNGQKPPADNLTNNKGVFKTKNNIFELIIDKTDKNKTP